MKQGKKLPRSVAMDVASLAEIKIEDCQEQFCDDLIEIVRTAWVQKNLAVKTPTATLRKAADAAKKLDEAVCSLSSKERKLLDTLVARHPGLVDEGRIKGRGTNLFTRDELLFTTWLVSSALNVAIGRVPTVMAGSAQLSNKRGKKIGATKNPLFETFVYSLLLCVERAHGRLTLEKNKYFKATGGPLADALNILRDYLPPGVVPSELSLSTLQTIKTKRSRARTKLGSDRLI